MATVEVKARKSVRTPVVGGFILAWLIPAFVTIALVVPSSTPANAYSNETQQSSWPVVLCIAAFAAFIGLICCVDEIVQRLEHNAAL